MRLVDVIKEAMLIDYKSLGEEDITYIRNQYVDECFTRLNWMVAIVFFGEVVLTFLDMIGGFFLENKWNYLNLAAELVLISTALIISVHNTHIQKQHREDYPLKKRMIVAFRVVVFLSIITFAFTDMYVRQKVFGAFIIYFFCFQLLPFYHTWCNCVLFVSLGGAIAGIYLFTTQDIHANSLFTVGAVYFAFFLSTECMRLFFIKKIINNRLSNVMTQKFERLARQTIYALSDTVEMKDLYTKGHSQRVANYSKEIAKRMGYSEDKQNEVYCIGLLHDIGKIGVRDAVINKNGRLDSNEYAEIKKHPKMGYEILREITEIPDIGLGARWHHERYDGNGYPDGIAGEDIPVIARIIAVADSYDAMTSNRSYRDVMPQSLVREEIEKNIGKQFAPETAKIMLQMIDEDTKYAMRQKPDVTSEQR